MKAKALISVTSKQGEDEGVEVVTPGDFYKKDNCFYAVYDETEISGMEGTKTTLKIEPEKFSLIRMGSTTTKMDFERRKRNVSLYNTPYGTLELNIETRKLDIAVSDDGGEVIIDYNMSVSGQKPMNTVLKVNIKTQKEE